MASADSGKNTTAGLSPAKQALLLRKLQQRHAIASDNHAIARRTERSTAPLSYVQQQMWFLDQLNPGDIMYNRPCAVRISGELDQQRLQCSLQAVICRHEALRTTFPSSDGTPFQAIQAPSDALFPCIDMTAEPEHMRKRMARERMMAEARKTFDLASGPLLRTFLIKLSTIDHIALLCTHHIVFDGWSERLFWQELATHYDVLATGTTSAMPELAIQYGDYAQWQRQRMQDPSRADLLQYWRHQLEGLRILDIPADRPRPAVLTHTGAREHVILPQALAVRLKGLSRQCEATLFMTLLAAFQALLGRYSGQDDIAVGTPVAGRQRLEFEPLIGVFINTLVLRARIDARRSFRELLAQVRTTTLDGFSHQEMPFGLLIEQFKMVRDSSRSPLIQVLFQLRNLPNGPAKATGLQMEKEPLDLHTSKVDLALEVYELPDGLGCQIEYNTDLFNANSIRTLVEFYEKLLWDLVAQPDSPLDQLDCWRQIAPPNAAVAAQSGSTCVAQESGADQVPIGGKPPAIARNESFPSVFAARVDSLQDHPAVVGEDGVLSYSQLNRRANVLARRLQSLGVRSGVPVALCVDRSTDMITAIVAILKSGGAYVPLDPSYPEARLQWMLSDSGAVAVVTHRRLLAKLADVAVHVVLLDGESASNDGEDSTNLSITPASSDLAYIIYTSGSTGTPKGVMVPHGALMHFVDGAQHLYGLSAADHVLQFASISFDGSIEEIFCALAAGATLFLRTDSMLGSMRVLLDGCAKWGISFLGLTTAYWHQLAAAIATEGLQIPASVRLLVVGGEKINGTLVRTWFDHVHGPVRLINAYGPTEATVACTAYEITPSDATVPRPEIPIGRPLGSTRVYILNDGGEPVPTGEAGELYIGGNGVASGYLKRRELTTARFVADRFTAKPGARMYRTGDSVRYRNDGEIEFLGRLDDQMKVRGYRIEPGEVEAVLLRHPLIRAAAVAAWEDRLIAYVVTDERGTLELSELRRKIGEVLPDYMIPSVYVRLEALPLTITGKVDRQALLALPGQRLEVTNKPQVPRTKLEEELRGIWCKVLGMARVGVHDNFFELGGHSLLATQVMSRVRSTFGVVVPLRLFFKNPTIEGLAREIEATSVKGIAPHFHADADGGQKDNASSPVGQIIEASFAQQRLWFLDQINPGQAVYIIDYALNITGPLDVTVLERAVNEILRRHDSLRTTIAMRNGEPVQVVAESLTMRLPIIDISDEPPAVREAKARTLATEISNQPFDLAHGPLLRLGLIRLGLEDHVLVIPIHHIVADGWSLDILQKELAVLYGAFCRGESSPLAELPIQYRDFTVSQREQLQNGLMQRQLVYWKRQLMDLTPLELPTARPHSSKGYVRGAQCKKILAAEVARGITKLGNRNGATLFMTVLAAFQLLLHRLSGQDDIAVGTPGAGRTHPDSESLIGLFVNNLVLRTDLSGNPSFHELLLRVKETTLAALEHQDVPFERLVQELRPVRDLGRNPLFDVMINYLSNAGTSTTRGGLTYQPIDLEKTTARFALTLYISEEDDGRLGLRWMYQADLFDTTSIECMADQLIALLVQIVGAPERPIDSYSLVTESTRSWLPDPSLPWPETISEPVTSMFLHWARRTPTQTALCQGNRQWSYEELAVKAQSMASSLAAWGVRKGDVVGISGDRSFGFVAATLAVLLAGGVMVPVDPTLPRLRRRLILETAQVRTLLWIGPPGSDEYGDYQQSGLPSYCLDPDGGCSSQPIAPDNRVTLPELRPEDPAYIFFTSGTSGVPSGVLGWQKGISHFVNWQRETFAIRPRDRIAQLTSISFDVLLRDLFLPLTSGATLCLPEEDDLSEIPQWLARMGITVLHTVPTLVQVWLKDAALPNGLPDLRWVFIAGEPLTATLVQKWRNAFPDAGRLVNLYGPTETTMVKCFYVVPENPEAGVQPIGAALPQTQILIMGPDGRLCGVSEPGEIAVRTPFRTLGYLDPDERVRTGFAMNPYRDDVHDLIYHTGDRGRYRPDGLLEILGRMDDQVKIRGVRIEPAEVSAVLAQHPHVHDCTVVSLVDKSQQGDHYLAAYVVPTAPNAVDVETLREYLTKRLPAVMVPANFALLDTLPLTKRGKVDRKALPVQDPRTFESGRPRVAPRTALERALASIWCDILKCSEISVHDDFFLLGGHSLLVTQMVARMRSQFRIDLPIRAIFEAPTIAHLAALIEPLQPVLVDAQPTDIPRIPRTPRSPGVNAMHIDRKKK